MRTPDEHLARTISRIAAIIALIVTVSLPTAYYALATQYQRGAMLTETNMIASVITKLVNISPDYWRYQDHRLAEILVEDKPDTAWPEHRYIRDLRGELIAESGGALAKPLLSVSKPIYDSGNIVAEMVIERSLRPLLLNTLIAALFGLLLGASTFITLRLLPLRALNRALINLRQSDERFSKAFNASPELILIARVSNTEIIDANESFIRVTGYQRRDVIGCALNTLSLISPTLEFAQLINKSIAGQSTSDAEFILHTQAGALRNVLISSESFQLDSAPCFLITARDVTTLKDAEQRLELLANYDTLTGLPNRGLFRDRLTQAMHRAARNERLVALMFLDLDRFKKVNDSLGHEAGDHLLIEVAERLRRVLRESDTLVRGTQTESATVSRLGGDEFTVIVEDMRHIDHATAIAQKILHVFEAPFHLAGCDLYVSASVGIAIFPFDDENSDELIKHADSAMYHAKQMGRNNFQFYGEHLNAQARERLELETALRLALERNEFILHYQPKQDLQNNQITGVEALVRWQHPQRGLVPPLEFIPLLEENGLIVPVGEWVMRAACTQAARWQAMGLPPMAVAVNLSPRQFRQKDLVGCIQNILHEVGLAPQYLELEITEGLLMDNSETNFAVLSGLKNMGVSIAIDDFGTGYSSLSYLKRFPINVLKIDRAFVNDISDDPNDAAIANAVIALGKSMHLSIVAEGVETPAQLDYLRTMGCDIAQGFLLSKPLPADALEAWLQQYLSANPVMPNQCIVRKIAE